jgi:hypothetical protein
MLQMKKQIIILMFIVLIYLVLPTNVLAVTPNYVKDPATCPQTDAVIFPGQNCAPIEICGNILGIAQCYDTPTIPIPGSYNPSYQSQVASGLAAGYVLDCYNPNTCVVSWWCSTNSTCNTWHRATVCNSTTLTNCGTCSSGYYDCDANPNDCEIQTGSVCYIGSLQGTYSGCTCVLNRQHFITGLNAPYSTLSTESLLWGTDYGLGLLMNLTSFNTSSHLYINSSGCILFNDSSSLCSGNITGTGGEPLWNANSSTVARTGNCPAGQVVMNTTTSGVQCVTPTAVETDPYWTGNKSSYYNKTEVDTNITNANTSVVNWINSIFVKISDIVSYVGNWTLDKPAYANYSNITTSFNNATIVRAGNFNCSNGNLLQNVTVNSSGIFGWCASGGTSGEPNWNANYSTFLTHITWAEATNGTLYLSSNPSGFYNLTSNIGNFTLENLTLARIGNFNCSNGYALQNVTVNISGVYGQCVSISAGEPLWNANYSTFLTHINWSQATNGTLYLSSNPSNFWNTTYYGGIGNFSAENGTIARTGNCPAGQVVMNTTTSGVQCIVPPASAEVDPYWTDNFTKYNSSWSSTYNSTYDTWAYNQTTPAINTVLSFGYFNTSNTNNCSAGQYAQNFTLNSSGVFAVCSTPASSGEPLWNANYSNVVLLGGRDGGQHIYGGTSTTNNLTLSGNSFDLSKGEVYIDGTGLYPTTDIITDLGGSGKTFANLYLGGYLRIREQGTSPRYFTRILASDQNEDITLVLPATQGNPKSYLRNNGTGGLSWNDELVSNNSIEIYNPVGAYNKLVTLSGQTQNFTYYFPDILAVAGTSYLTNNGSGFLSWSSAPSYGTEVDPLWTANQSNYYNRTQVDTNVTTPNLHTHNAANITAGTFGTGNYTINGNLTVECLSFTTGGKICGI